MAQEGGAEIISLIKDLQRQMAFLEKKIDMLVNQSAGGRPLGSRSYSQTPRTYGGGEQRRDRDTRESRFGAKSSRPSRPFEKNRNDEGRGFAKKKKTFKAPSKPRS